MREVKENLENLIQQKREKRRRLEEERLRKQQEAIISLKKTKKNEVLKAEKHKKKSGKGNHQEPMKMSMYVGRTDKIEESESNK